MNNQRETLAPAAGGAMGGGALGEGEEERIRWIRVQGAGFTVEGQGNL